VEMMKTSPLIPLIVLLLLGFPARAMPPQMPVSYLAYTDGYWQVWVMTADGKKTRQVTKSSYDKSRVSWYPDGNFLLVNGNQGELSRVNLANGTEILIPAPLKGMNDAVLSPDGRHIAFSLSTSGSIDDNNIWLVDADGSNERKLTNMEGLQHEPSWSPDGKRIYFLSGKGGQAHDIWELTLATRETKQLTSSSLYHFDVAVAPDGGLAFSSNRSGNYEIWTQDKDGNLRQITNDPAMDGKPGWSPDGTSLIFESTRSGQPELWRVGADGSELQQLTRHEQGARAPVWHQAGGGKLAP